MFASAIFYSQVVVNQTLTLSDFNYSDDKWDLVNETL